MQGGAIDGWGERAGESRFGSSPMQAGAFGNLRKSAGHRSRKQRTEGHHHDRCAHADRIA